MGASLAMLLDDGYGIPAVLKDAKGPVMAVIWVVVVGVSGGVFKWLFDLSVEHKDYKSKSDTAVATALAAQASVSALDKSLNIRIDDLEGSVDKKLTDSHNTLSKKIDDLDRTTISRMNQMEKTTLGIESTMNQILRNQSKLEDLPELMATVKASMESHKEGQSEIKREIRECMVPRPEVEQYFSNAEFRLRRVEKVLIKGQGLSVEAVENSDD